MKKFYKVIILLIVLIFLTTYNPNEANISPKKNSSFFTIQNIEIVNNSLVQISEKKETTKACSAPKNKGKLKFLIKFPINIICKAQKSAHNITKLSPNLIVASEKSLNK